MGGVRGKFKDAVRVFFQYLIILFLRKGFYSPEDGVIIFLVKDSYCFSQAKPDYLRNQVFFMQRKEEIYTCR